MSEFERAFALMDELDRCTAERLEPTPFGPVVVHTRLNRVHDLNFFRAEAPGDASAKELAAEAERVQSAAGIGHRRVNVRSEKHRERLEPEFVRLRWEPQRFVLTVQYPSNDDLEEVELREGICDTRGAVRLREEPIFCWVPLNPDGSPADDPRKAAK